MKPGFDPLLQAYGGMMSVTGRPEDPPTFCGASINDKATGMFCTIGALAALRLRAGELDAAFASTEDPIREGDEQLQPLFPDAGRQVVQRFFERRGFVPPNHTVLMQRRLAEEHPWLPAALYEAFEQSKQEAYRRDPRARSIFPDDPPGRFGDDPYPSGLAANRATLQMAAEQEVLEGTIGKPPDVDSLIQESLRGT
jgi:hypothetical protein